jgi:signal transduction histidine kinase
VLGAVGIVYLAIAPRLESRLRDQAVLALEAEARFQLPAVVGVEERTARKRVREAAARAGAEILLVKRWYDTPSLDDVVDSNPEGGVAFRGNVERLARSAVATGRPVTRVEGSRAFTARPIRDARDRVAYVAVFADTLTGVEENVALIRRQILVSAGLALLIAVLAGFLVARALAARVLRLESAARKVAAGDFSQPLVERGNDELGQLAAAFDDMQRQLARLDSARKQFIASASHELRTPIFSLGGFLELLADEDLDEETRAQFLAQVRGQVDRLETLATELLDLSRLESGALELRPEPTDVAQLAREVVGEFHPALHRHGSEMAVGVVGGPLEIECDPARVAQVVRILLDNAVVHTPPGTPIRVSAARENGHVLLEVSDRGLGIPATTMPHIFEPFFSSDDNAQGAGLGLAIARELADRMQGELRVRSGPGTTTFTLVLPA